MRRPIPILALAACIAAFALPASAALEAGAQAPDFTAPAYLAEAVRERRNILIAGGTSSGKTTFLGALLKEIPREERRFIDGRNSPASPAIR